jgi:hypothetical protein
MRLMALPFTEPELFDEPEPIPPTHDIVHELTIFAPADAVFDAITSRSRRVAWWPEGGDHELESGQIAPVSVMGNDLVIRVEAADRPEVVIWECAEGPREWVGTSISFRIEARPTDPSDPAAISDDGRPATVLRFWHGGWQYEDGLLPRASFDWAMFLDGLRRSLEGQAPR